MATAVLIHRTGGPEVIEIADVDVPPPGKGEVRLKQTAIGLNYIDTYHRSGLYPIKLPGGLGTEAAGIVEALGEGVTELKIGDRVAYAGGVPGSYATERNFAADRLVPLPDTISEETAAAALLQGMTVEYLLRRTYPVKAGDTILLHAAAGGVGLIACQWARAIGATVIGTVSTDAKAELAKQHGCTHAIVTSREDFVARVKEITNGAGVPVVYDGVGKDVFMASLDCLRPRGMMVTFGNASGPVAAFEPGILAPKGSLFVTRPTLANYVATRAELLDSAHALFDMMSSGKIDVAVHQRFALKDAAEAHRTLEARKTVGSTLLIP